MRIHYSFFIICSLVALTLSCSEELTPTPYTYTRFFTGENSKTWKVKLFEQTQDGVVVDRFLPSCLSDDRYVFHANSDHAYETTSGSRKCFEDELNTTSSTWSFRNATATLTMAFPLFDSDPGSTIPFFVRDVDDDDMELELYFGDEQAESYRIQFELVDEE